MGIWSFNNNCVFELKCGDNHSLTNWPHLRTLAACRICLALNFICNHTSMKAIDARRILYYCSITWEKKHRDSLNWICNALQSKWIYCDKSCDTPFNWEIWCGICFGDEILLEHCGIKYRIMYRKIVYWIQLLNAWYFPVQFEIDSFSHHNIMIVREKICARSLAVRLKVMRPNDKINIRPQF